jgi:hypothetical protein
MFAKPAWMLALQRDIVALLLSAIQQGLPQAVDADAVGCGAVERAPVVKDRRRLRTFGASFFLLIA